MKALDVVIPWAGDTLRGGVEAELLRYVLRSVADTCAWARRVALVTPRPLAPDWLDDTHPALTLVHHDEIMAPFVLPSANPHSIESHLHRIQHLSAQYVVLSAHTLLLSVDAEKRLMVPDGRAFAYVDADLEPSAAEVTARTALSKRFKKDDWPVFAPGPVVMDAKTQRAMCNDFATAIAATRSDKSAFPGDGVVATRYLGTHYAVETGRALREDADAVGSFGPVLELGKSGLVTWWRLSRLVRAAPPWITVDLGEAKPGGRSMNILFDWLDRAYPDAAPWEA